MTHVIEAQNLQKDLKVGFWGHKKAILHDVTFKVPQGAIVGFVGPNGAGKSTTIKLLLGAMKPTQGQISVLGQPPSSTQTKAKVGYLPEIQNLPRTLKPVELIQLHLHLSNSSHVNNTSHIDGLLEKVGMRSLKDQLLKGFSKGQQQRVGLALALCHTPDLLILDEPMSGLDPIGRKVVRDIITEQKAQGKTIFFSSHVLPDVEALCDEIILLNEGRTLSQGPINQIFGSHHSGYELTLGQADKILETMALPSGTTVQRQGPHIVVQVDSQKECLRLLQQLEPTSAIIHKVEAMKPTLEEEVIALIEQTQPREVS
ncbi:MAG: ABC transporter [Myxococcales bacterium]|nr:ABC transporter [Myxococcales bacterium]